MLIIRLIKLKSDIIIKTKTRKIENIMTNFFIKQGHFSNSQIL